MKKYIAIILLLVLTLTFLPVYAQNEITDIKAKVIKDNKIEEIKQEGMPTKKIQNLTVRILEGEYENEEYEMVYVISDNVEDIISNIELQEDDNILIQLEEKEGEVISINYKERINKNYTLYVIGVILLIILIVIGVNVGIKPVIIYLITVSLVSYILILSVQVGWNLILVSSIISFVITTNYIIKANGINGKTLAMIFGCITSISFAGVLISILYDITGLANVNVKITENFVNIKELICSSIIVVSCGICNIIILIKINIDSFMNRAYKTKSDNIIEGQRSLKL